MHTKNTKPKPTAYSSLVRLLIWLCTAVIHNTAQNISDYLNLWQFVLRATCVNLPIYLLTYWTGEREVPVLVCTRRLQWIKTKRYSTVFTSTFCCLSWSSMAENKLKHVTTEQTLLLTQNQTREMFTDWSSKKVCPEQLTFVMSLTLHK